MVAAIALRNGVNFKNQAMAQNRNYKGKGNYKKKSSGGGNSGGNRNYKGGGNNRNHNKGGNRDYQKRPPSNQSQQRDNQQREGSDRQQPTTSPKAPPSSSNDLMWFFFLLILVAGGFLFNKYYLGPRKPGIYNSKYVSPPFRKEGQLSFLDAQAGKNIIDIDIEIANTTREQLRGLKNRNFLPANAGLLYVYNEPDLKTFTMESIFLSLDFLFINDGQEIIRISKNTHPQSPASIPSGGKVQYVLQVQGGFCDAFNIRVGDHVEF